MTTVQAPTKHQVMLHGVLGVPMHKIVSRTKRIGGGWGHFLLIFPVPFLASCFTFYLQMAGFVASLSSAIADIPVRVQKNVCSCFLSLLWHSQRHIPCRFGGKETRSAFIQVRSHLLESWCHCRIEHGALSALGDMHAGTCTMLLIAGSNCGGRLPHAAARAHRA